MGTFSGLYIGKSGVQSARGNLNITGQNITNVNTDGYTRQRANQTAVSPFGTDTMYSPGSVVYGGGSEITSIEQVRDAFLDSEYRSQNAVAGSASSINDALQYIEQIFYTTGSDGTDEDSTSIVDVLNTEYSKFVSQLESLVSSSSTSNESNVLSSAKSLATSFNTASKALDTAWDQQYTNLSEYAVTDANDLLKSIASLNDKIKASELSGTSALELLDQRNLDIDQLSQYCNIKVSEDTEYIGDKEVHTLHIKLLDGDGNPVTYKGKDSSGNDLDFTGDIINGDAYSQLSVVKTASASGYDDVGITVTMPDENGKGATITKEEIDKNGNTSYPEIDFADKITTGKFGGYLELLNSDGTNDTFRGIGYYKGLLDTAASNFAETANKANSTNDDGTINKPLFTSGDGKSSDGITAGNIRIASAWSTAIDDGSSEHYLTFTKETANPGDSKNASFSNITDMITSLDKDDISGDILKIGKTLGIEIDSASGDYKAKNSVLSTIENNRESLSAVDIDDETVNLIKFNQALGASARFITTVDECLDTLINKMGV